MTKCKFQTDLFPRVKSKKIGISFDGGDVTSDAGIFLLRQADKTLKLSHKVSKIIPDPRNPFFITHSQDSMIQQLLYGLALGYEDLNDHESLREDLAFQSAVEREEVLAGKSTLCRLQQRANKHTNKALSELLVDLYIKSQPRRPKEIILDFDATDTPLHGDQQDKFFHGYYDNYCYLPLFVFAGDFPLYALLRKSDKDASQGSDEILSFLTERLRKKWPGVRIIFRGDSGFCRWKLHQWCEKNKVEYITGLARNSVLMEMCRPLCAQVEKGYAKEKVKQKKYRVLAYGAKTWDKKRRVLVKAEYNSIGPNTRFVVTNIKGTAKEL
ncbi:MAG: IS1380 family transposase, partial [Candidatus Aminicenantes bacterium]|nr:IS1380 family transposase [Candidatus Aminicenantes bacterium]NIT28029.1 IS1380 family transposase [Candidatus Aminicenantes bacterium]